MITRGKLGGTTLAELMVALTISMIILFATYRLYLNGRRNYEQPRASMRLQEEMMRAVRQLQRDLAETNVQSVQSYPNPNASAEPPGLSLLSPRSVADDQLIVGEYGVVRWQKYVYYTLVPDGQRPGTGTLRRREGTLADQPAFPPGDANRRIPVPSAVLPSAAPGLGGQSRTLCAGVMLENTSVPDMVTLDSHGGFHVYWLRSGVKTDFDNGLRGEPVMIDMAVSDVSTSTGQPSVLRFPIQVTPRN